MFPSIWAAASIGWLGQQQWAGQGANEEKTEDTDRGMS